MESIIGVLLIILLATVSGALAIPLGIALGLNSLVVYVATTVTAISVTWFLLLGGHGVQSAVARYVRHGERSVQRTDDLVARSGSVGFGLVGPLFPGVIGSVLSGVALRLNANRLGWWLTFGIIVWFGLFTVVWSAVRHGLVG